MTVLLLRSVLHDYRRRSGPVAIYMLTGLFIIVVVGSHLTTLAARNLGYIALNRVALGPTYSLGRCGPASPYTWKADAALGLIGGIAGNDAQAENGLAITRLCEGDLTTAVKLLQEAHRLAPGDKVIEARLGTARLLAGDAPGAVVDWNGAGAAAAEVHFLYQHRIASEEPLADALYGAFSESSRDTPPLAFYWLATWLEERQSYGPAASMYGKALADHGFDTSENRPAAARREAFDLAKTNDWPAARTALEATLIDYPNFPDLWVALGDIYRDDLRDDARAIQAYERAIAIPGGGPDGYVHLGDVFLHLGQPSVALCYFRTGLQIDPNNPFTHVEIGRAYLAQADNPDAASEFELALDEKPDLPAARTLLSNAQLATSQPTRPPRVVPKPPEQVSLQSCLASTQSVPSLGAASG